MSNRHKWKEFSEIYIFLFILGLVFPLYMVYRNGLGNIDVILIIALGLISIFLIPQAILQLRYYKLDKEVEFFHLDHEGGIEYKLGGDLVRKTLSDVRNVILLTSYPKYEKRMQWLPWDEYFAYVVKFKDDKQIIITSFKMDAIRDNFLGRNVEVQKMIFPYVFYDNV